jgi:aminomethyltransferase
MSTPIARTALFEEHVRLGARMVPFAGWEMPVQYKGLKAEHLACRSAAGLFDVSHMGEIEVEGPGSGAFLNRLLSNDVLKCDVGQAMYTVMCFEHGGIVDDLVFYRRGEEKFFLVVNASNTDKDWKHLEGCLSNWRADFPEVKAENTSAKWSQIALQGPKAQTVLQGLTEIPLEKVKPFRLIEGHIKGVASIVARTGYTGEDGFELYVPWADAPAIWRAILGVGAEHGIEPVGLGARDTLRLEKKFPLYGQELTAETNPLEAGLGWVVKLDTGFLGSEALAPIKEAKPERKLIGFEMIDRGIPRSEYPVFVNESSESPEGIVTSGTHSPSLEKAIGIAYVPRSEGAIDREIWIGVRGRKLRAKIVKTPFA